MKATGMTRPVDALGRVVLPKELRDGMEITEETRLEVFVDGDSIILKKYQPGCFHCKTVEHDMFEFGGVNICSKCKALIREALNKKENR